MDAVIGGGEHALLDDLDGGRVSGRRRTDPPAQRDAVADAADKPDEYLTMKIDAVEALSTLLTRLGA